MGSTVDDAGRSFLSLNIRTYVLLSLLQQTPLAGASLAARFAVIRTDLCRISLSISMVSNLYT